MNNRLKVLRAEKNITQDELANLCGISRTTVNSIETGKVIPNGDTMLKLSKALGEPIEKIFLDSLMQITHLIIVNCLIYIFLLL